MFELLLWVRHDVKYCAWIISFHPHENLKGVSSVGWFTDLIERLGTQPGKNSTREAVRKQGRMGNGTAQPRSTVPTSSTTLTALPIPTLLSQIQPHPNYMPRCLDSKPWGGRPKVKSSVDSERESSCPLSRKRLKQQVIFPNLEREVIFFSFFFLFVLYF